MYIPEFEVIKEDCYDIKTDFEKIIREKTLLKIKLKLLHILAFDKDLKLLEDNHLSISSLELSDFKLTESFNLVVPVKDRIIKSNISLKLKSYFIYLSYLYNIDLIRIYKEFPTRIYKILFELNLPDDLTQNMMNLLSTGNGEYFSFYYKQISTPNFRENIYNTSKKLEKRI